MSAPQSQTSVSGSINIPLRRYWDLLSAHIRRLLDAWRGARCVIGVADQAPPDGDIDFCRRIAGLARQA